MSIMLLPVNNWWMCTSLIGEMLKQDGDQQTQHRSEVDCNIQLKPNTAAKTWETYMVFFFLSFSSTKCFLFEYMNMELE